MTEALTDRQVAVLTCIREWISEYGEAPTIREIGNRVGLSSPSTVVHHLARLERLGFDQTPRAPLGLLPPHVNG